MPTLTFLFNTKLESSELLYQLLLNLSYEERYFQMLRLVTVHAYDSCLREMLRNTKFQQMGLTLEKLIKYHEVRVCLRELSVGLDKL